MKIPPQIADKIKLTHHCYADGAFHIPPSKTTEVGVIIGVGNSIEEALADLKTSFAEFGDEPVSIEDSEFVGLIESIKKAEDQDIPFSDQAVPDPTVVLEEAK